MEKEEFLRLLPKLIREDDEIKGAIITALSGVVATKEDIARIIEHSDKRFEAMDKRFEAMDKRFEAMDKRFEAMDKRFEKRFEAMDKRFEVIDKRFEVIDKRFEVIDKRFEEAKAERKIIRRKLSEISVAVGSLGDRSGKLLEDTIIEILNDELIKENIRGSKIKKIQIFDKEGIVFTRGFSTDIDLLIEDGKVFLIEVKYTIDNYDIFNLIKRAELYQRTIKDYDELLIITLEIKRLHLNYALEQGIKVISGKVIE